MQKNPLPKGSFVKNFKKLGSIIEGVKILTAVKNLEKKIEHRFLEQKVKNWIFFLVNNGSN